MATINSLPMQTHFLSNFLCTYIRTHTHTYTHVYGNLIFVVNWWNVAIVVDLYKLTVMTHPFPATTNLVRNKNTEAVQMNTTKYMY